jgi:hypothetical protein
VSAIGRMGDSAMPTPLIRWGQHNGGARLPRYLSQDQRLRLSWTAGDFGSMIPPSRCSLMRNDHGCGRILGAARQSSVVGNPSSRQSLQRCDTFPAVEEPRPTINLPHRIRGIAWRLRPLAHSPYRPFANPLRNNRAELRMNVSSEPT